MWKVMWSEGPHCRRSSGKEAKAFTIVTSYCMGDARPMLRYKIMERPKTKGWRKVAARCAAKAP